MSSKIEINVFEEHHNLDGKVTNIILVSIVELKESEFRVIEKEIYKYKDITVINELLEANKYFGYNSIEVKEDFYIDCFDSDFKYKRPHIVFSLKDIR